MFLNINKTLNDFSAYSNFNNFCSFDRPVLAVALTASTAKFVSVYFIIIDKDEKKLIDDAGKEIAKKNGEEIKLLTPEPLADVEMAEAVTAFCRLIGENKI